MSTKYKFDDPEGTYFISTAVVEWIDVFTRREYKDILIDSLKSLSRKCFSPGRVDLCDNLEEKKEKLNEH